MTDPAFPKFPPEELAAANQKIADCLALSRRAMEEAASIADRYKIVVSFPTPLREEYGQPITFFYSPERNWINSTHQCAGENYNGSSYGWTNQEPELTEHDNARDRFLFD